MMRPVMCSKMGPAHLILSALELKCLLAVCSQLCQTLRFWASANDTCGIQWPGSRNSAGIRLKSPKVLVLVL